MDAHDGCRVDRSKWQQIAIPPIRDALLDLPLANGKTPVRKFVEATNDLREVWFESSTKDLQICLYDPQKSCHGGRLRKLVFTRRDDEWAASNVEQVFCSD